MANIIHTSTGAGNTPKNVDVIGTTIALPTEDLILLLDERGIEYFEAAPTEVSKMANNARAIGTAFDIPYLSSIISTENEGVSIKQNGTLNEFPVFKFYYKKWAWYYSSACTRLKHSSLAVQAYIDGFSMSTICRAMPAYKVDAWAEWQGVDHSRNAGVPISASTIATRLSPLSTWYEYPSVSQPGLVNYLNPTVPNDWRVWSGDVMASPQPPAYHGEWINLTFTIEVTAAVRTMRVYINGELVDTNTHANTLTSLRLDYIRIGMRYSNDGDGYCGDIASSLSWKKTLSAEEVKAMWEYAKAKYGLT